MGITLERILMSRSYKVSADHYAYAWRVQADDDLHDREAVNVLAIQYAGLSDGPEKEALFLQLLEHFHGVLIKYVNMVISGRFPSPFSAAGKDAAVFLKKLAPRGTQNISNQMLSAICKSLHLSFKQMTTDDVYDVMVLCFLSACKKYDPKYSQKVQQVCEVLDEKFPSGQFTTEAVAKHLDFDATKYLRLLAGKQFLETIYGKRKKVLGYQRRESWPPPKSFFQAGPVGFVYYANMWFKYYLGEYILAENKKLENRKDVLQLEHRGLGFQSDSESAQDRGGALPHAEGNFTGQDGTLWAADTALMNHGADVSPMTDEWVLGTTDKLFAGLTKDQRWMLQMLYVQELSWVQISAAMQISINKAQSEYQEVMTYLKYRAAPKPLRK